MEKVSFCTVCLALRCFIVPPTTIYNQKCSLLLLQVKLKQGLKSAMAISSDGNAYLQVNIFLFIGFHLKFEVSFLCICFAN
jgi:hypothetical protein